MGEKRLKNLIERLDAELENTDITDQEIRESVLNLIVDLKAKLENFKEKKDDRVSNKLEKTALELEVKHPTLTKTLNEISTLLSSLGI